MRKSYGVGVGQGNRPTLAAFSAATFKWNDDKGSPYYGGRDMSNGRFREESVRQGRRAPTRATSRNRVRMHTMHVEEHGTAPEDRPD